MPGLRQLEQFVSDIKKLGDEELIKSKRGEPVFNEPLPSGISEDDDSDDFIDGIPEVEENQLDSDSISNEDVEDNSSSISQDDIADLLGDVDLDNSDLNSADDESLSSDDVSELLGESSIGSDLNVEDLDNGEVDNLTESTEDVLGDLQDNVSLSDDSDDIVFNNFAENPSSEDSEINAFDSLNDEFDENSNETIDMTSELGNIDSFENTALSENDDFSSSIETKSDGIEENSSFEINNADSPEEHHEDFSDIDMSDMEGLDFGAKDENSGDLKDEFPPTEADGDDFLLSDDFEIPGFSDTESADFSKKKVDTVDFSKATPQKTKNSLTEEEYERFKKNLSEYPLNLKVVIEETISKDDSSSFTDDVIFEIIDKILKKTPARQLASYFEKLLDISISIPRDFEHRTYEQYEAYKASFQYQLKNRIIPAAIACIFLCIVGFGLFKLGQKTIYEPIMARINYSEGYELIQENEYAKSEEKFEKAVSYRPVKSWFFKYARGYREHRQYERAAKMYKNILAFFKFDKEAGLEYANMELYDRANYAEAEKITRRYVLDYHINDPQGELLLGDIFLEWAENDDSKYQQALEFYSGLISRFPNNKLYLSRMLRYYIRKDQLKDVLEYKAMFYPQKKSLSSQDWTELSGYLLDKLYGTLSRNDEYLRASIEDVRAMLEIAVESDPSNPIARYNLARYFIHNNYNDHAKAEMANALKLFKNLKVRTKKNVYKEINASRILGELYSDNREYIKALEIFTNGVNLFNDEHQRIGLDGDENVGKLFSDIADIDYFITGDVDSALANYETAIQNKNDTSSINFRVGAIRYGKKDYDSALKSFIKVSEDKSSDTNLLIALANVLSLRGDNFAAQSYYTDLLRILDAQRDKIGILYPQDKGKDEDKKIIELYIQANNNLGVTLYRLAKQTGDSDLYAQAMVRFSDSMRAWDSNTRSQITMIKSEGSNLAALNSRQIMHPISEYEPAIYSEIPRILSEEKVLE